MTDTHYAQDNETDSEMTTSEDTTTGDYNPEKDPEQD